MKKIYSFIFYPFIKLRDYLIYRKHMRNLKKKDPYLYK